MKVYDLSEIDKKILDIFMEKCSSYGEDTCLNTKDIIFYSSLIEKEVRISCKKLSNYGLIKYVRGLMDDEGRVAGSGYYITYEGRSLMFPCQQCGEEAHYSWWEDEKGMWTAHIIEQKETDKYFQLCEEHYQKHKELKNEKN